MKFIRNFPLFFFLIMCGCASWTKPLLSTDKLSPKDSFIYGRFKINSPNDFFGFDGYQTIGIRLTCSDGKQYTIRFNREPLIQVIKLPPTTCTHTENIFTDADGVVVARSQVPIDVFKNMELNSGSAYYVGDFQATSRVTGHGSMQIEWKIDSLINNYQATTKELINRYPNLNDVSFVDRLSVK